MSLRSLGHLLEPERVVWIGPAGPPAPWALAAEHNLFTSGFKGSLHALHGIGAAAGEALRTELAAVPPAVSLAVVCLPQSDIVALARELATRGCRAVLLLGGGSAAFSLDAATRARLQAAAREHDMRIVGPDRVGVLVPSLGLNAGSAAVLPPEGDLAFLTQSDSIATAMLEWAAGQGIGFSRVVSLGDSADVELGDLLDFLAFDRATRAVLIHLEGIADARRFMSAARAASRVKPVLALKAGRYADSGHGTDAAIMEPLPSDRIYDAAFARAGMVRVASIEELFAAATSLGAGAVRRGHGLRAGRLAILGNGRAPAALAVDMLIAGGGELAQLDAETQGRLAPLVENVAACTGPVDLGLEAGPQAHAQALDVLLGAPGVDAVLVIHAPAPAIAPDAIAAAVAERIEARRPRSAQRPVLAAWLGGSSLERARSVFERAAIPAFEATEPAVRSLLHRIHHERRRYYLHQTPSTCPDDFEPNRSMAAAIIGLACAEGRPSLNEPGAMALLEAYGIPGTLTRTAATLDEAAAAAGTIGYPVALKIVSSELSQKSAIGGVALDIGDEAALRRRGRRMLDGVKRLAPEIAVEGLLVQRMERWLYPIELHLAMAVDPTFGPVLHLGLAASGLDAADTVYLLPPLNATLAAALLAESRIGKLLRRRHDAGLADLPRLLDVLVRLSQLVVDHGEIGRVAIDPLLVSRSRIAVLDAHIEIARLPPGMTAAARLAVRPYPRELEQTAVMRDGRTIRLRPIRPEDAPALQRGFRHLTPEDRRRRLFTPVRELSDEFAARLSQIDYDREMVLVALDPDDPHEIWGGARIAADPDLRRAEYSVTIRSDKQGLGLGRICFERVLDYAGKRGIEEVWGSVLAENDAMLGLARRLGFKVRRDPDDPDVCITTMRLDKSA